MVDMPFSGELEAQIKSRIEDFNLYEKELTQLNLKNETFKKEIQKKDAEIRNFQKQCGSNAQISKENYKNITKATAMITLEEQILKEFSSIQQRCNLNLQEKYKLANIERLVVQQKDLNISYIIIKKLDVKEEFYIKNKILEVPNLYENLKSISKIGKLNYDSLKNCGPYLVFRLTSESKFQDLKRKACAIWGLPESSYSLYDDMFINMECTNDANIQSYFSFYQPADSTLPTGHACLYLMEKLKNQKSLLDLQSRTLDKADSAGDNDNGGPNFGSDLENCISKIEEGLILKGINCYKKNASDPDKNYKQKVLKIENNIVYMIVSLIYLALSLWAVQEKKKDMYKWSNNNQNVYNFFQYVSNFGTLAGDISECNQLIDTLSRQDIVGIKIFGQVQYRFFKTKKKDCVNHNKDMLINTIYRDLTELTCYYTDYEGDNIDKTSLVIDTLSFDYSNDLNISHTFDTKIGKVDRSGNSIRFNPNNKEEYKFIEPILIKLKDSTNDYLGPNIQGFEFSVAIYDVNLDIFTSILILFQKDLNNEAIPTVIQNIPFIANVYEKNTSLKAVDLTRLILSIFMLSVIVLSIIQKCWKDKNKTILRRCFIVATSLFKAKFLLLIFSFSFIVAAFSNFNDMNLNSMEYVNQNYFIDFHAYAMNQKAARYWDQLSMYLLFIYMLKYLQFLPYIGEFYKSIKKSAFELFFLFFIIFIFLLSLSYLTYYVYGIYFREYSEYYLSLVTNIKILLFIENAPLRINFIKRFQSYSIVVFILYTFIIRFFLLLLIYPIFIEYLRVQLDKLRSNQFFLATQKKLTTKEKLMMFLTSCRYIGNFLKEEKDKDKGKKEKKTAEQEQIKTVDGLLERTE